MRIADLIRHSELNMLSTWNLCEHDFHMDIHFIAEYDVCLVVSLYL
jgi:hypothetical protein